jgi:hypothetical protein
MSSVNRDPLFAADDSGRYALELALRLEVQLGPEEDLGPSADGHRINYPIIGGRFAGPGISGIVIPGGADMSVRRPDGVTLISALYRIKTDDDATIIVDNQGIWRPLYRDEVSRNGASRPADAYLRTTPRFIAPVGKYDWLNRSVFIGTVDDIDDMTVLVSCHRVLGV